MNGFHRFPLCFSLPAVSCVARLLSTQFQWFFFVVERTRAHMHARTRLNLKTHSENEIAHENNLVHFLANIFFTCIQHVYWMLCKMSADFFDRNFIRSLALATAHKWRNLDWECKWPCKCTRFFLFCFVPCHFVHIYCFQVEIQWMILRCCWHWCRYLWTDFCVFRNKI